MISLDYLSLLQISADADLYLPDQLDPQTLRRAELAASRGEMWRARPAMTVYSADCHFWVSSHFHRYDAALRAGCAEFWCDIKRGSKQAAIDFSRKSAT